MTKETMVFWYAVDGVNEMMDGIGKLLTVNAEGLLVRPPSRVVTLSLHAPIEAVSGIWTPPTIWLELTE